MKKTTFLFALILVLGVSQTFARSYRIVSPDTRLAAEINVGKTLRYNITLNGRLLLSSTPALELDNGEVWGKDCRTPKATEDSFNYLFQSPLHKNENSENQYNSLILKFRNWAVEFRAYNGGIAYRFVNRSSKKFNIVNEQVNFVFEKNHSVYAPYVNRNGEGQTFEDQYFNSFENHYTHTTLSGLDRHRLIFLPMAVEADNGVKLCFSESNLENYPGLYLVGDPDSEHSLKGHFAPYPKTEEQGGHNMLQMCVTERENFIAKVEAPRNFPWRIVAVSEQDRELAGNDMTYLLADESRIGDISWIKPGKVAWEWWNALNLCNVDFQTGINNETYLYYIDFAAAHGIEYVIMDEGWAVNLQADLMQVVPEIDLPALVAHAREKGVGIILWAGYHAFERDMEEVCRHYSRMGIKGFKIDFMDRDDQKMTAFNYRAAETAAKYKLVLDLHGTHKPAGINRTWPNVLNNEGVFGLEQMKGCPQDLDQMEYDVLIPFIRQFAGPMDYTQGAMHNASRTNFNSCFTEPMSQGTRCHQLGLYMVLDSPLNMLCDSPSNYMREEECTRFIAEIPTVWDQTLVLDGVMGEYIITARRSGNTWYVGGITDWNARDLEFELPFLRADETPARIFRDGRNADKVGRDYKCEDLTLKRGEKMRVHLAPGGGFALKIEMK